MQWTKEEYGKHLFLKILWKYEMIYKVHIVDSVNNQVLHEQLLNVSYKIHIPYESRNVCF